MMYVWMIKGAVGQRFARVKLWIVKNRQEQ